MPRNSTIKIKDVSKDFFTQDKGISVLKKINVDIHQNEFLMIFGPSGCGKTTLLNIISGLERPTEGKVETYGMDLWSMNDDDRAMIRKKLMGIMYQNQNWIKSLSVLENVAFSQELLGDEKEKSEKDALKMLESVGMQHRANYSASELSSGEQQKVSTARALIGNPKLIIADEPTGNLDIRSGHNLMNQFKEIKKGGKTIVMVTHNPEYLEYADRVIFMLDGEIHKDVTIKDADTALETQKEFIEYLSSIKNTQDKTYEIKRKKPKEEIPEEKKKLNLKELPNKILNSIRLASIFWIHILGLAILYIVERISKGSTKAENRKKKLRDFFTNLSNKLKIKDQKVSTSINGLDLADLSYKNLLVKKSRTMITVFGMGIGIGFIVFLVSIGYGLENLVLSAIAQAEDLKQVEIIPNPSNNLILNNETIFNLEKIAHVDDIQPILGLVAQIDYEGSQIDTIAYAIEKTYLDTSSFTINSGSISNDYDKENGIVVSKDFLLTLGLNESNAIGEIVKLSFTNTGLLEEDTESSSKSEYEITATVSEAETSVIYVPLSTINQEETTYSQARVILTDSSHMQEVRHTLEVKGYSTVSITDTVTQIQKLFRTLRIILTLVGFVALTIAVLGMVNTLTVSLLERTREIGLLKIIGMRSNEIRTLFITESMIMGVLGSIAGLIIGTLLGQIISMILSIISLTKGGASIDITSYPIALVIGILLVGTVVGYMTGLYPAKRAVNMSPLDALRYE